MTIQENIDKKRAKVRRILEGSNALCYKGYTRLANNLTELLTVKWYDLDVLKTRDRKAYEDYFNAYYYVDYIVSYLDLEVDIPLPKFDCYTLENRPSYEDHCAVNMGFVDGYVKDLVRSSTKRKFLREYNELSSLIEEKYLKHMKDVNISVNIISEILRGYILCSMYIDVDDEV